MIVNKKISNLTVDENELNNGKVIYESALKQSWYESTMIFDQQPLTETETGKSFDFIFYLAKI